MPSGPAAVSLIGLSLNELERRSRRLFQFFFLFISDADAAMVLPDRQFN